MAKRAQRFKESIPRQKGEMVRLKVMRGPDIGVPLSER